MSLIEPLHPDTYTNIDIHIKALHTGNSVCDGLLTDPAEKYNKNSNVRGLQTGREIRACGIFSHSGITEGGVPCVQICMVQQMEES